MEQPCPFHNESNVETTVIIAESLAPGRRLLKHTVQISAIILKQGQREPTRTSIQIFTDRGRDSREVASTAYAFMGRGVVLIDQTHHQSNGFIC